MLQIGWGGLFPISVESLVQSSWVVKCCNILHCCYVPNPRLRLNVCYPTRPNFCLCPSGLPSEGCTLILYYCCIYWGPCICCTDCSFLLFLLFPFPSCLHYLLRYSHLHMSQCIDLSDMFVCRVGDSLLIYSCPTCRNFKERNVEVLSCHHALL